MFELAMPWSLVILPLPWFVWMVFPRAKPHMAAALQVPFFNVITSMTSPKKTFVFKQNALLWLYFIWFLMVVALAGPRWVGAPQPLAREGHNIMLALDLSGSMELNDMLMHGRPATRLAVVKQAAAQFVQDRSGDKIGLILFGSQAYLQTPLTFDRHTVLVRLEDASVGLAGQTTSIGDALGLAIKRLQQVPKEGRIVILLTDGVNNSGVLDPLKAAELAQNDGIKVYTIGLGAEVDPRILAGGLFNRAPTADLDEDTLKEMARMTGGRYFRATDGESLQDIYRVIHNIETVSQDQASVRPQYDYYPWVLALALILFLTGLVRTRL